MDGYSLGRGSSPHAWGEGSMLGETEPKASLPTRTCRKRGWGKDHPRDRDEGFPRRLRLIGAASALVVILAGCASSPEAGRAPGEPGADPGNHGNPAVLLAPPDRFDRVYHDIPYDGPAVASEDTSGS